MTAVGASLVTWHGDDALGVGGAHRGRDAGADVAAVDGIPLIPELVHQLRERARDPTARPAVARSPASRSRSPGSTA